MLLVCMYSPPKPQYVSEPPGAEAFFMTELLQLLQVAACVCLVLLKPVGFSSCELKLTGGPPSQTQISNKFLSEVSSSFAPSIFPLSPC